MLRHSSSDNITALTLRVKGNKVNDRLHFGGSVSEVDQSRNKQVYTFEPSSIFSFVRWRGDEFGTQTWRVVVAQAGAPGERLTKIPGVEPGAHLLLHAYGKAGAKRALRAIEVLSDSFVLHEIEPAYWRHVHIQVARNLPLEPYDPEAFAALARAMSVR